MNLVNSNVLCLSSLRYFWVSPASHVHILLATQQTLQPQAFLFYNNVGNCNCDWHINHMFRRSILTLSGYFINEWYVYISAINLICDTPIVHCVCILYIFHRRNCGLSDVSLCVYMQVRVRATCQHVFVHRYHYETIIVVINLYDNETCVYKTPFKWDRVQRKPNYVANMDTENVLYFWHCNCVHTKPHAKPS